MTSWNPHKHHWHVQQPPDIWTYERCGLALALQMTLCLLLCQAPGWLSLAIASRTDVAHPAGKHAIYDEVASSNRSFCPTSRRRSWGTLRSPTIRGVHAASMVATLPEHTSQSDSISCAHSALQLCRQMHLPLLLHKKRRRLLSDQGFTMPSCVSNACKSSSCTSTCIYTSTKKVFGR